jgi:signal transduction histidine kinase
MLLLQSDSNLLLAEMPQPVDRNALLNLQEGSTILVSGISLIEVEGHWDYEPSIVSNKLLLRSSKDIQVLIPPSWWTTLHVIYLAALFAFVSLVFLALVVYNGIERWKLQAVLEERERMAHEIHDTLAQSFAGIGFQLQAIRKAIPAGMPNLRNQVDLAKDLVRHSHREARRSLEPLTQNTSEDLDVLPSLEACAHKMVEGGSVEIVVASAGVARSLPRNIASCLIRIGQEAIANAIRHADPDHLDVLLTFGKNTVCLLVKDDGKGFVKSGDLLGFGLRGMRKRAACILAKLEILSQPGQGTQVEVTVPLPRDLRLASFLQRIWKSTLE